MKQFYIYIFLIIHLILFQISIISSQSLRIAICITGQLARLELISKIRNVFIPNMLIGHYIDVYILLDGNTTDVKQTYWKYNYTENLYAHFDSNRMQRFIQFQLKDALPGNAYNSTRNQLRIMNIRIESPSQNNFQIRGNKIPVEDKSGPIDKYATNLTISSIRFQNNMRWLNGLRDCVRWLQQIEVNESFFYDIVIRLRDDSFAILPWLIDYHIYKNNLVSTKIGSHFGINDHDFVIDRKYADTLLRGITEDYYFNSTLDMYIWGNPEHRIYKVAESYNIPMIVTSFCEHPMIPLRGKFNKTHWRVHFTYAELVISSCLGPSYELNKFHQNIVITSILPQNSIQNTHNNHHYHRIGLRRTNITNLYTKDYLELRKRRNRDITFNQTIDNIHENYCCNDFLINSMHSQAISIEHVYAYV